MLPIQSLHLHRISPELGSGLACWKTSEAFPDFEQIDCVVSGCNPQFVLGILCSFQSDHNFTGGYCLYCRGTMGTPVVIGAARPDLALLFPSRRYERMALSRP